MCKYDAIEILINSRIFHRPDLEAISVKEIKEKMKNLGIYNYSGLCKFDCICVLDSVKNELQK